MLPALLGLLPTADDLPVDLGLPADLGATVTADTNLSGSVLDIADVLLIASEDLTASLGPQLAGTSITDAQGAVEVANVLSQPLPVASPLVLTLLD